jgi:D-alanyl-D-alanine carboxypeptidase/D-alanyl-D-alanine-endopeptidase (penicillin-binding protein 4)
MQTRRGKGRTRKPRRTSAGSAQALLVETMEGKVVQEQRVQDHFHPASTIKLATALFTLRTFGPDFIFETTVSTNGRLDATTGTVEGDIYIEGKDPSFRLEHAIDLARELNKLGIKRVTGRLFVASDFTMESNFSAAASAAILRSTLDARKRSCKAVEAFNQIYGDGASTDYSVEIQGTAGVGAAPSTSVSLAKHQSATVREILKSMLCYSDNFMAEKLGAIIGGAKALNNFLVNSIHVPIGNVKVDSASGLGNVSITAEAMMKVLRALIAELKVRDLKLQDILPVAGIDEGTLQHRFTEPNRPGTVVAKTGTHIRNQGGISALVGEMQTVQGPLLFVILNRHGSVPSFRAKQNELVESIQDQFGGPVTMPYTHQKLAIAMRVAPCSEKTRHS